MALVNGRAFGPLGIIYLLHGPGRWPGLGKRLALWAEKLGKRLALWVEN